MNSKRMATLTPISRGELEVKREDFITIYQETINGSTFKFCMNFNDWYKITKNDQIIYKDCSIEFAIKTWNEYREIELETDQKILVSNDKDSHWVKAHFSHFDENGRLFCFPNGRTSWTKMNNTDPAWHIWRYWKLAD